ncbi:MAG: L,D-transpeptidase [Chloroflexi bacterium]|nr:L,D-transpeptidase [Chloroflexota bacterium]
MMESVSRRDFLKLGSLSMAGLAFSPGYSVFESKPRDALGLVRVAVEQMRIFKEPSYSSEVLTTRTRDQLLYVYDKFTSPSGPEFNPLWYQLSEGFAHTAYLQPVETQLNDIVSRVPEGGQIFEVTVPLTQSYRLTKTSNWEKLYRLYFRSTHWVTGIETGPDGALWYRITDELLFIEYYVLASHLRPILPSEITPISARVDPGQKRVEISIAEQRLWAYEEEQLVLDTKVSTGIPGMPTINGIPTATPTGSFNVMSKMPVRHMGDGRVTSDINAYELPGVPWVSYFHETGVAFHGTYWHDNYGNEMSHGCVNMQPDEAKWLFRWLTPESEPDALITKGYGTRIIVS